ncbi:GntR family transcriptional regulator [Gordonia sp. NPDC003429]
MVAEVCAQIDASIKNGHVLHGGRLPSERELARQLGVSRWTVRAALDNLATTGVVRREPGRGGGTFATTPNTNWPMVADSFEHRYGRRVQRAAGGTDTTTLSLPALLKAQGFTVETRDVVVTHEAANAQIASRLGIDRGAPVIRIERIRVADNSPVSAEVMWLNLERFPDLTEQDAHGSLWDLFGSRYGLQFGPITEEIEIQLADRRLAKLLEISPGQPLLCITRVAHDTLGTPVEYSVDRFRGENVRLVVETNIGPRATHAPPSPPPTANLHGAPASSS